MSDGSWTWKFLLCVLLLVLAVIFYGVRNPPQPIQASPQPSPQPIEPSPAQTRIANLFAELIRLYGYRCPAVKDAESFGVSARGKVMKIWCGEYDGPPTPAGVLRGKRIEYRVTELAIDPRLGVPTYRVEPWRD